MRSCCCLLACLALAPTALALDDSKSAEYYLKRGTERFGERDYKGAIADFTECLRLELRNIDALDRLGSAYFMVSKFKESVADFDAYLKLVPKQANGHWRRGISLYYARRYDEGKKQFEGYEKVDTNDVENAVWHFLCAAKKDGLKKARAGLLKIGKDGRTPMMEVYDLFKGKLEPADVLKAANAGTLPDQQRRQQLFYAHLYLGLWYDVTGDRKKAVEHLALAAGKYKIGHYMGEVARVASRVVSAGARK
jgi:lipoprotein NlpI